jgi:hypothetical protein
MIKLIAIWLLVGPGQVPVPAPDFQTVLTQLRANGSEEQFRVFEVFAASAESVERLPELLKLIDDEAPKLDNNGFLLVSKILQSHPGTEIPLNVLLKGLQRSVWNSQQKCLLALEQALNERNMALHREELLRFIVPLTTSQRSRVYEPATRCLQRITGEKYGPDPEEWNAYFERNYRTRLDLRKSVYELVVVFEEKTKGEYEIAGKTVLGLDGLKAELQALRQQASQRNVELAVIDRLPEEKINKFWSEGIPTELQAVLQTVVVDLGITAFTFSPPGDVFRPPYAFP